MSRMAGSGHHSSVRKLSTHQPSMCKIFLKILFFTPCIPLPRSPQTLHHSSPTSTPGDDDDDLGKQGPEQVELTKKVRALFTFLMIRFLTLVPPLLFLPLTHIVGRY